MAKLSHEEKTALHQRIATHYENKDAQTEDSRSMVVVKSNSLIQQTRYELSLQEQRLLLYLISKIKPDDKTLEEIEIPIIEFCKVCGINYIDNGMAYQYTRQTLKTLADKSNWIEFEENVETLVRWIDTAELNKIKGKIKVGLSKTLIPYLLDLKKQYTTYPLLNILPMKSKYSIRLYELLKSYANLGSKKFEVSELKKRLNAENYKNITNFKQKVLYPALKDIDNYADIKVSVIYIKSKNRITHIEFIITLIDDINEKVIKWENIEKELG